MSDAIKKAANDATKAADAALADASKLAGTVSADASKYANQATIGMQASEKTVFDFAREHVWGVIGAAIILAVILFWAVMR